MRAGHGQGLCRGMPRREITILAIPVTAAAVVADVAAAVVAVAVAVAAAVVAAVMANGKWEMKGSEMEGS